MKKKEFEINPGIIISKINLKEDDTVITTFNGVEITNGDKK